MTGGAWKDTESSAGARRNKAKKQPAPIATTKHQTSCRDEDTKFQIEVDLADLRLKLRRWNFARSWKIAASRSLPNEAEPMSPRTRRPPLLLKDAEEAAHHSQGKVSLLVGGQVDKRNGPNDDAFPSSHQVDITMAQPNPPLDRKLVGQYLDRCIAAAESQLVGVGSKSRKKGAVEEIERLVEMVIATQADCG